MLLPKQLHA